MTTSRPSAASTNGFFHLPSLYSDVFTCRTTDRLCRFSVIDRDHELRTDNRRGVVWLAQEETKRGLWGEFFGYWEADVDGPVLEEVEGVQTVAEALSWGRSRARCVLIRLARSGYFSAGVDPPHWDLELPVWNEDLDSQ